MLLVFRTNQLRLEPIDFSFVMYKKNFLAQRVHAKRVL
jgi:hypothetical protein